MVRNRASSQPICRITARREKQKQRAEQPPNTGFPGVFVSSHILFQVLTAQIDNPRKHIEDYSLDDLLMSDLWICGITPPPAMVPLIRVSSSSSPRIASCKCLGVIRFTLRSLLAFPANSSTSAVRYSNIAAVYTAAVAPTLPWEDALSFNRR